MNNIVSKTDAYAGTELTIPTSKICNLLRQLKTNVDEVDSRILEALANNLEYRKIEISVTILTALDIIGKICQELFQRKDIEIKEDSTIETCGGDSFDLIEMVMYIEYELDIEINEDDLEPGMTMGKLAKVVEDTLKRNEEIG